MTPCMSPLPHDSPLIEKPGLGQIQEESEGAGFKALPGKGLNICKAFASSILKCPEAAASRFPASCRTKINPGTLQGLL